MMKSKLKMISICKDGVDMISNLPDPILQLILSRVPTTEEVIRTSILSRRWRYLWTWVPFIDICFSRRLNPHKELKENKFKEFVYRVLTNNTLDLDSFRLSCGDHCDMWTMGEWIDAAVRRNIKVVDFLFWIEYHDIELPRSLVTCRSLEVLKLRLCTCRLSLPKFTDFPALRVLELNAVALSDQDLVKEFLKSCPLLEDLTLVDCLTRDLSLFCISCPKLMNLRIHNRTIQDYPPWKHADMCNRLQICCPKLVFLEFLGYIANEFVFESLDSLKKAVVYLEDTFEYKIWEVFAGISHLESLSLPIWFIEKYINLIYQPESLPNLKTLELTTKFDADIMDVLIQILTCSPNLECLHIIIEEGLSNSSSPAEAPENYFLEMECTFKELKMVKLSGISVVPHHMRLMEFMLENTPFLETMSITPSVNMTDEKSSFLTELLRFQRASPEAEIIFAKDQV